LIIKEGSEGLAAYNNFWKRTFTSLILIALVMFSLMWRYTSAAFIFILLVIALYEFFFMVEKKGIEIYRNFGMLVGVLISLSIILQIELTISWQLFLIVLAIIFLILMQFRRQHTTGAISGISVTIFGILYVSWFLSFLIRIRYMPDGRNLLFFLILVTKLGDIGAYLVGSRFGKTPLLTYISPSKSWEGAWAGLFFSLLGSLACKPLFYFSYPQLVFLGIFLGILGQLGDLSESLIKRDCGVKDASNLLPGIGGILDLVDSFIFSAPVFYFYMNIILR